MAIRNDRIGVCRNRDGVRRDSDAPNRGGDDNPWIADAVLACNRCIKRIRNDLAARDLVA